MARYLAGGDKYRGDYQFGRTRGNHARGRAASNCVNGYLKAMIEAVANSKLRRMERELELRGIRYDRPNDSWVARKSQLTQGPRR
jgi:hypothetical protein